MSAREFADKLAEVSTETIRLNLLDRERVLVAACRNGDKTVDFSIPGDAEHIERYILPSSVIRRWWWLRRAGYRLRRHR